MDFKKLFIQIISILLVVVVVACVGTAIKRSGEPEKEYDFTDRNQAQDAEDWADDDILDGTEEDSLTGDSEGVEGDETVSTTPQNKIMYTTSAVNVRSGPGRGYEWLGRLELGAEVTAVGDAVDEWQQVIYNGQTAYIAVEYLEVRGEPETPDDEAVNNTGGDGGTTTTPGGTTTPSNPVTPPTSETPSAPSNPAEPDDTDTPAEPENPNEPSNPDTPVNPDEPDTPGDSDEPGNSEGSDNSEDSSESETPDESQNSESSEGSEESGASEENVE